VALLRQSDQFFVAQILLISHLFIAPGVLLRLRSFRRRNPLKVNTSLEGQHWKLVEKQLRRG
jgi:hypothetical protein